MSTLASPSLSSRAALSPGAASDDAPVRVLPLSRYRGAARWRIELAHTRPHHLLIWLTRGQARATIDGLRQGCGTHNALFVPSGTLMSMSLGPQAMGLGLAISPAIDMGWPSSPQHLRIRQTEPQAELSALVDAIRQESARGRRLLHEALIARTRLVSVWLRRQMALETGSEPPVQPGPQARLAARCARLLASDEISNREISDISQSLGVSPQALDQALLQCCGLRASGLLDQCLAYTDRLQAQAGPTRG